MSASEIVSLLKTAFWDREEDQGNRVPGFFEFYRRCVESKKKGGYRDSIEYTFKTINEFADAKGIKASVFKFKDVTLSWLKRLDEWLECRGSSRNTRNIHFRNIRTVLNRAIDEEYTSNYPFRRFKIRPEITRKRSLSVEDLRRLFLCEVGRIRSFIGICSC